MHKLLTASLLLLAGCATLPPAPPHAFVSPTTAGAPPPLQLCWLETAGMSYSAGMASAGVSQGAEWDVTASALLIHHPKGALLIDTGSSPALLQEAEELGLFSRFFIRNAAGRMAPRGRLEQLLGKVGLRPDELWGIVLSHAHPDHAGGVARAPGVPVWVGPPEVGFIQAAARGEKNAVMPAQARALVGQVRAIPFAPAPYANYDESWDVFGDGTVVVVPTYGHTPGSVATFVSFGAQRLIHVGDLINVRESIDRNVPKSRLFGALTDEDGGRTRHEVAKLVQLRQQDPAVQFLPAHDRQAWEAIFGPMSKSAGEPRCLRAP